MVGFIRALPGGLRVHSGSFERTLEVIMHIWEFFLTFVGALGVVVVIRVCCVLSGSPRGSTCSCAFVGRESLGSFRLVAIIHVWPACRRFHLVDSSAPWVSFGSFGRALGVVSFIRARRGGHRVHSGSLGAPTGMSFSFLCAIGRVLDVVAFICVCCVHSGSQ